MIFSISSRTEQIVLGINCVVVMEEVGTGDMIVLAGGSSGALVMCVRCGRHVDDGVMTSKGLLSVNATLKINGGREGV